MPLVGCPLDGAKFDAQKAFAGWSDPPQARDFPGRPPA
jgi:hypothetical protein